MTVKERLILFLTYKKMSQKRFAKIVGLSDGYVNAIRKSIQPDTIHRISMCFPELNAGWLLTGEGEMLKDSTQNNSTSSNWSDLVALVYYKDKYYKASSVEELKDVIIDIEDTKKREG